MKIFKTSLIWFAALVITLAAAVYQRATGPTYPKKIKVTLNNQEYKLKLIRSSDDENGAPVRLDIPVEGLNAKLHFRRYPTTEAYFDTTFVYTDGGYTAYLPIQPPAGKLEYYIEIENNGEIINVAKDEPLVIRFKGVVPKTILFPHIFFMFLAMLVSTLAGLSAIFNYGKYRIYTFFTFAFLLIGGMILGPLVQLYAFGELWTGVPFGWDLTDNKTLIGVLFWLAAVLFNLKRENRTSIIIAAVMLLLVYSIPHSMFGSQLNPETGKIIQAYIPLMF